MFVWDRLRRFSRGPNAKPLELRLFGKPDCGLCDAMRRQIEKLAREIPLDFEEVDITTDPTLERDYFLSIPVLVIDGEPAFRGSVGDERLRERLLACQRRKESSERAKKKAPATPRPFR